MRRAGELLTVPLLVTLPMPLALWAAFGARPALAGLALSFLLLVHLVLRADSRVTARLPMAAVPPGLSESVARVMPRIGGDVPRIKVLAEPVPQAFLLKGATGPGTLLLTQGLLAVLSEAELRVVLLSGIEALRHKGRARQTIAATLAIRIFSLAPPGWARAAFGPGDSGARRSGGGLRGPISALGFSILYPIFRHLYELSAPLETGHDRESRSSRVADPALETAWKGAMHKLAKYRYLGQEPANPALLPLSLFDLSILPHGGKSST